MRSPLVRATACPECGRPVCGVLRRTFAFLRNREKANCPYCGCPCYTPLPLYGVILAVGAACAYPVWRIGGGWGQIVEFFLLGYVLAGVPLMALVPFRARGGVRAIQPLVRIKRPFDYRADDVWHAARNVLRRSKEDNEVLSADRQRLELSIKRKTRSDRMDCCFWLSVEPAESGGDRMVVCPARGYDEEDLRGAGDELEQVCLLTEEELERFSRPRIGPGGHT